MHVLYGRDGVPQNGNGGLTIVPMPGFEGRAEQLAKLIHEKSQRDDEYLTPVDIALPEFLLRPSGEP